MNTLRTILAIGVAITAVPVIITAFVSGGNDRDGRPMWWILGLFAVPWMYLEAWNMRRRVTWDGERLVDQRLIWRRVVRKDTIAGLGVQGRMGGRDGVLILYLVDRRRPSRHSMEVFARPAQGLLERLERDTQFVADGRDATQRNTFRPGRQAIKVVRIMMVPLVALVLAMVIACWTGWVACIRSTLGEFSLVAMAVAFVGWWIHGEMFARNGSYSLQGENLRIIDWRRRESLVCTADLSSVKLSYEKGMPQRLELRMADGRTRRLSVRGFPGGDAQVLAQRLQAMIRGRT